MQHQHTKALEASLASHSCGGASYDGQIAGLYDLEETLGSGHFAVVKLARHVFTGAKVAVKVVDKTKLDDVSKAHLFQEVRCMKLVQHPNVVRLYEVIDTKNKLYLVLELGDGGDLYDYIMKHDGGLNENLARKYFRQILRAITYCHELHVVHRDLKPENVVFFEKLGVVKLTDFGFSNKFSPGQKLETFCGSLAYSAPEILLGDSYDAPAVDIWSLGVILYMLVCGQPPFEKGNDSETLTMIMDCKYTIPTQVTHICCKLIASMLVRDPKKRATLKQIAAHPWLQENSALDDAADFLPLVKREQISEEDHAFIIQKMINGNIASKEDILQALDKDKYNHITATYFLLAEIRLRKRREDVQYKQNSYVQLGKNLHVAADANKEKEKFEESKLDDEKRPLPKLVPINIEYGSGHQAYEPKMERRTRKCSIVREEDEEESSNDLSCEDNELKVATMRRESISDGRLNCSVQQRLFVNSEVSHNDSAGEENRSGDTVRSTDEVELIKRQPMLPQKTIVTTTTAVDNNDALVQKLSEDCITTATSSNNNQTNLNETLEIQDTLRGLEELKMVKSSKNTVLTSGHHRRHTKLHKIRTPSCSSSEASDTDDTKTRNKKKIHKFVGGDTPVRFRMHRRDSHDDSSDSQDQGYQPSTNASRHTGHETTTLITTNTTNNSSSNTNSNINNKKNQSQNHNQNKNEESRLYKSLHSLKLNGDYNSDAVDGTIGGDSDGNCDTEASYGSGNNDSSRVNDHNPFSIQTSYHKFEINPPKENLTTLSMSKKLQMQQVQELYSQKVYKQNLKTNLNKKLCRRRIRESQSLDRITEAQEYDQFRCHQYHHHFYHQHHRLSLPFYDVQQQTFPVTKEEEEYEIGGEIKINVEFVNENNNGNKDTIEYKNNSINIGNFNNNNNKIYNTQNSSQYKLTSIDEIDLIWNEKNFTNVNCKNIAITATTTSEQPPKAKYLMTMKKVNKFPAINVT